MRTIYLKTPFYKQYKLGNYKYLLRLDTDYCTTEPLTLASPEGKVVIAIKSIIEYPTGKVPWRVLDNLNLKSREQLLGLLQNLYKRSEIPFVQVLEIERAN